MQENQRFAAAFVIMNPSVSANANASASVCEQQCASMQIGLPGRPIPVII